MKQRFTLKRKVKYQDIKAEVRCCCECGDEIDCKNTGEDTFDYCENCELIEGNTETYYLVDDELIPESQVEILDEE